MNELAKVRKRLQKVLGQDLPDPIWEADLIQDAARDFLEADADEDRAEEWRTLEDGARERLLYWNGGREERGEEILRGTRGSSPEMEAAASRDLGPTKGLDAGKFVGGRTEAMVDAMAALFTLIADQMPEVREFREGVLSGRLLSTDEAHALIASYAARTLDRGWFEELGVPFVGHRAEILEEGPRGSDFDPTNDNMTLRIDPPGITETVRYAYPHEGDALTRCLVQRGAVVPIHTGLPIGRRDGYTYASWLWPGSIVDKLYDLSVELAGSFDWPLASAGTRPRSESAAWYILTGEAPRVRPIEARWEAKSGSIHLNPQWRIRLTVPPWLPEEEVLRALRMLRREMPGGRKLPKTARPLAVARFVWEQERRDGYREPPPWKIWCGRWNEEHRADRFKTAGNFREYFYRADAAVKGLNFSWPSRHHGRK